MQTVDFTTFEDIRNELLAHPMYKEMTTPERVQIFMKHHIFAVWDFMSLLKRLQQSVTSVSVPWLPYTNPNYTRFINEIVLGEESDEDGKGNYCSHFELYLEAMKEAGADTGPIDRFISALKNGENLEKSIQYSGMPESAAEFVRFNLNLANTGEIHEVASAFFYGREDLIPEMFQSLLDALVKRGEHERLEYYLKRHIELDGDEHGPLAEKLLTDLCGDSETKREESIRIAKESLNARKKLWDGVLAEIREKGI